MTSDKFNQIVENRANERVAVKVKTFIKEVAAAFEKLHPSLKSNYNGRWAGGVAGKLVVAIFNHLLDKTEGGTGKTKEGKPSGFPVILWEEEREAVANELLATLDEMQKALMAPASTEPPPIAVQEENKTS